jgi:hypothetical protein
LAPLCRARLGATAVEPALRAAHSFFRHLGALTRRLVQRGDAPTPDFMRLADVAVPTMTGAVYGVSPLYLSPARACLLAHSARLTRDGPSVFLPHVHRLDIENASLRVEQAAAASAAGKRKGKGKAGKHTGAAGAGASGKRAREARVIPSLVYAIEQYERHIIQLSQVTKVGGPLPHTDHLYVHSERKKERERG